MLERDGYKKVILGARYSVRLEDLKEWHVLEVKCSECERHAVVHPSQLRKRHANYVRLAELEKKFKCSHCGNQEMNHWQIFQMPRNA